MLRQQQDTKPLPQLELNALIGVPDIRAIGPLALNVSFFDQGGEDAIDFRDRREGRLVLLGHSKPKPR